MKFNLAFEVSTFFVGRNDSGEFIKTDDSDLIVEFDSFKEAQESPAHEFFTHDRLSVVVADSECGYHFSACLGEDESACCLDCGCILWRSASYTDREVSITFCPLHEQAEKLRDVLGRLHDLVSNVVEVGGVLRHKEGYQELIDLLVNESLPLVGESETRKAPAVVAADDPAAIAALRAVLPYVPGYAEKDTAGRPWLANALAVVGDGESVETAKRDVAAFNVYLCVEPVDDEGDNAGDDLDLPFGALAEFPDAGQAMAFAASVQGYHALHEAGETPQQLIQRVFSKVNEETETWRGPDYIGSDLAYLAWAIAEGPGKGCVEWDEYNAAFVRFREWFAPEDPVWQFIKCARGE